MIPSQMLKGMLEGCILEIINKQETYAYEISEKLSKYGFGEISEGTIYPIILRLQKNEMISSLVSYINSCGVYTEELVEYKNSIEYKTEKKFSKYYIKDENVE